MTRQAGRTKAGWDPMDSNPDTQVGAWTNKRTVLTVEDGHALINGDAVFAGEMDDLLASIDGMVRDRGVRLVVTANVDHILDIRDATILADAYRQAEIRTIDGMPVLWLFRRLRAKNLHRLTGADLLPAVVAESAARGWRIAVTGGSEEALRLAVENLRATNVDADIHAVSMPLLRSAHDPSSTESIELLKALNPHVIFVCMGAPKQEAWVMHWRDQLPDGVYIGAGAAVEFEAKLKKRAPAWIQRIGLEWVWRLVSDARRLAPRYLHKGPRFLAVIMESARAHRASQAS